MDTHFNHLRRGFNWLGSATVIAKLIDFGTIVTVLLFLTKEQVGVASLVVSIGMVVESINGLGTGEALVQAKSISQLQLDSVFWFVIGLSLVVTCLILLVAPVVQMTYGITGMSAYLAVVAMKQPIVGAALIPLSLMNRELCYERIAVINVSATLAAAVTRLTLAICGAGAWALVIGFSMHGLFVLIGAQLARPFLPRLSFDRSAVAPLARFGVHAAATNTFHQLFKNVDFISIGWFYGAAPLAIYRVAFDIAMEPAEAVSNLVNRTALPVFARAASTRQALSQALGWSLRRLAILVLPVMVALMLAAGPLTSLLHDGQGHSYSAAALPLQILAGAALLRVSLQLIFPLLLSSGRPDLAARLSATTLVLLTVGIAVVGMTLPEHAGLIAVAVVWLLIYPLLLGWAAVYVRRHWQIAPRDLAAAFVGPAAVVSLLLAISSAVHPWLASSRPAAGLAVILALTATSYAAVLAYARWRPSSSTNY